VKIRKGLNNLVEEGLISKVIGGQWILAPRLTKLVLKIELSL